MTKQLQQDSKFNQFDTDGDGVVTDEELSRSERMIQIENNDKMQDQQRLMAWVAMWSTIVAVGALLSPFIAIDRMNSAAAFLNTFLVAQTGIVVGFMGATAWVKRFQSSWRPATAWVCVIGMALNFLVAPICAAFDINVPQADTSVMMPVLMGLLGLGGLRSFEKTKGVAK
jgi:hypothetical protein